MAKKILNRWSSSLISREVEIKTMRSFSPEILASKRHLIHGGGRGHGYSRERVNHVRYNLAIPRFDIFTTAQEEEVQKLFI